MAHNHKATKTTSAQIQSPTARSKLAAQTRPYFVKVADGAWIGYRKPLTGPGSWVARVGAGDGKGWEKTLWQADDGGLKPDGAKVLSFWQAKTEVQKLAGWTNDAAENTAPVIITLDEALKGYGSALRNRGADAYNARQPRPHLSAVMLSKPLTLLTKDELEKWRDGLLEKGLAPATVNRMMTRTAM